MNKFKNNDKVEIVSSCLTNGHPLKGVVKGVKPMIGFDTPFQTLSSEKVGYMVEVHGRKYVYWVTEEMLRKVDG